jgi:hypothetical protein
VSHQKTVSKSVPPLLLYISGLRVGGYDTVSEFVEGLVLVIDYTCIPTSNRSSLFIDTPEYGVFLIFIVLSNYCE